MRKVDSRNTNEEWDMDIERKNGEVIGIDMAFCKGR